MSSEGLFPILEKSGQMLLKKISGGYFISEAKVAKSLLFFLSDTGIGAWSQHGPLWGGVRLALLA